MMKLSLMNEFFKYSHADYKNDIADSIIKVFHHDENSLYFYRASANFVCRFTHKGQIYFLRFNHEDERQKDYIEEEIKIMLELLNKGIKITRPMLSINDRYVETITTKMGVFHACVFEGLTGDMYETDELSPEQVYLWGKSLGHLHTELKSLNKKYMRPTYLDHLDFVLKVIPEGDLIVRKEISQLKELCKGLPIDDDNYGLIHFDFEIDNIVWKADEIYSLDYDDSAYYFYICDILNATRDYFENDILVKPDLFQQFIEGYKTKTSLNLELLNQKDLFIRLHHAYFYGRIYRSLDINVSDLYPEWMNNLITRLTIGLEDLKKGFLKWN